MKNFNLLKCSIYSVLFVPLTVSGQVGIGTSTPASGSVLDLESANKGLLIPRLQLSGSSDSSTVPIVPEDQGTMIYNLADSGQVSDRVYKSSFHVWNGSQWEDIAPLSFSRQTIDEHNRSKAVFVGNPATAVTANASTQYTPWTDINFSNESFDPDNIHNNGTFTIIETGLYSFAGGISTVRSNNSGANKYYGGRIILNGNEVASSMFGTGGGGSGGFLPLYWSAWLNAGDIVKIQYRMRDSTASGTFTVNVVSNMSIIKNSE
ncbi:MAG: hypothetical protein LBF27_33180 [Sphingobacterium sp.]|jgi:hypothetical protein|nr:hypothetical protein [Sphingobacterium sp.]